MRRSTKLLIAGTLLVSVILGIIGFVGFPQAKESELKTATVTLGDFRFEVVGSTPTRYHSRIKVMIFTASDGEQYQIAMFYKDKAEELTGHTVTFRYIEDGGDWSDTHMIVELTEGDTTHYTLERWNQSQRSRAWSLLLLMNVFPFVPLAFVIEDLIGIFGRAKRHRRYARKKDAHTEQLDNLKNRPHNFPNTVWQTPDGRLTLAVDSEGRITGIIRAFDGDTVKSVTVAVDDTAHTTIRMALYEAGMRVGTYIEIWEVDYDHPDRFIAKPKKTTYFKKGKTVTVRCVDGERSEVS